MACEFIKKDIMRPLLDTYHERANDSSPYALPDASVLSRLQNVTKVCDGSRTVSEIQFQINGPETAKLHGPARGVI